MQDGWVKLHRKVLDSQVFASEGLFQVWCWCLMRAGHKPVWVSVNTGRGTTEVKLESGQFLFGRKTAAKELRMKPRTLYDRIQKLQKMQNIAIQPNTHYSIITICNWDRYQGRDDDEQQPTQQRTNSEPTANQQRTNTNKNVKNDKNVKKYNYVEEDLAVAKFIFEKIRQLEKSIKEPNFDSWANTIRLIREQDRKSHEEIKALFQWANQDSFWCTNILSPDKLRKKWDALAIQKNHRGANGHKSQAEINSASTGRVVF